ncbi:PPC domain-containing DNA-binding protein [Polyangium jinanense]|uniref:DUF296 domain-containing protein n=1 Tax=Polyangium jinanense TaxID=2829994 RepID=A0A9X3XBB8_9BACT|nr:DUF296 domain-containing protein [Polyangium jinanense]MDC3984896.1 DUF296 domain-containing protein [Polyangium jinanense]
MNVVESKGIRHLVVRAESGEELPRALAQALDEASARAGRLSGTGVLDSVELASVDADGARVTRRIDTPVMAVSITGNIAQDGAAVSVRLYATLVQESPFGLQTVAGEILSARALSLEVFATALDDVALVRQGDDRSFAAAASSQAQPQAQPQPQPQAPSPPPARAAAPAPRITHPEPPRAPAPFPAAAPAAPAELPSAPTPLARPMQHRDDVEVYPETGDLVSHFHFGECEVMSSDGERIRLRQEKDGRVREVALGMLKIEAPTTDPATGKRHFRLSRKH